MSVRLCVVIPTYNRVGLVRRAVESVLSQATDEVEIMVVDDGSTDSTGEYLASVTDHRVHTMAQPNLGVCAARNAGVNASSADFVTFLDDDDEARPGWINHWLSISSRDIDFASCALVRRSNTGDIVEVPRQLGAAFGGLRVRMLAGAYCLRRPLFDEVGGFREGLRLSENTDLALRLGGRMLDRQFSCDATDEPLVLMNDSTSTYDSRVRFESAATLLKHDRIHLERDPELLCTYAALAGVAASRIGERRESFHYLWLAIRTRPTKWRNYARIARAGLSRRRKSDPG